MEHQGQAAKSPEEPVLSLGAVGKHPGPAPLQSYSHEGVQDFEGLIWKGGEHSGVPLAPPADQEPSAAPLYSPQIPTVALECEAARC